MSANAPSAHARRTYRRRGVWAKISEEGQALDRKIGARVRALRLARRLSQQHLATRLGVSFQQVQKYEKGTNRIAASTLVEIARALKVPPQDVLPASEGAKASALDDPEVSALLGRLNGEGRRLLLRVARSFAQDKSLQAPRKKRP